MRQDQRGKPLHSSALRLRSAREACDHSINIFNDVLLLLDWLRHDILAAAGPSYAQRCVLHDFVVAEFQSRVEQRPIRLRPIDRLRKNGREEFLAFAKKLDENLDRLGSEFQCSSKLLRGVLQLLFRDACDSRRYKDEAVLRQELRGRFFGVCGAVDQVRRRTVRARSLIENLDSRLRGCFFLLRHLGADCLALLQFFLKYRRFLGFWRNPPLEHGRARRFALSPPARSWHSGEGYSLPLIFGSAFLNRRSPETADVSPYPAIAPRRTRTYNPLIKSQLLCQLS